MTAKGFAAKQFRPAGKPARGGSYFEEREWIVKVASLMSRWNPTEIILKLIPPSYPKELA